MCGAKQRHTWSQASANPAGSRCGLASRLRPANDNAFPVVAPTPGLMTRETVEPGTVYAQQTDYAYDAFGHRVTATVSGAGGGAVAGIATHVSSAGYDAIGQFQTSATAADG